MLLDHFPQKKSGDSDFYMNFPNFWNNSQAKGIAASQIQALDLQHLAQKTDLEHLKDKK